MRGTGPPREMTRAASQGMRHGGGGACRGTTGDTQRVMSPEVKDIQSLLSLCCGLRVVDAQ